MGSEPIIHWILRLADRHNHLAQICRRQQPAHRPRLNAGTVAIQYLFAQLHSQSDWAQIINSSQGFSNLYSLMFGDPWARGDSVNPILPPGLKQPMLTLPFEPHVEWSFTGGPHGAWEHDGSLAAVDFAPTSDHGGCAVTSYWAVAAAPGLIVRSENGVVVEDLDGMDSNKPAGTWFICTWQPQAACRWEHGSTGTITSGIHPAKEASPPEPTCTSCENTTANGSQRTARSPLC